MNVPRAASLLLFLDKLGKRGGGRNSLLHLYIMFFSFNMIDFFSLYSTRMFYGKVGLYIDYFFG